MVARRIGLRDDGALERLTRCRERPQLDLNDRQVEVRLVIGGIDRSGLFEALRGFTEPLHLRELDPRIHLVHRFDTGA